MTFLEMQNEVGELLNIVIDSTSTVTDTQVRKDLNTARGLVLNRLLSLGQNYNVRIAKADLVANQSLYSLPSDFRKFVRLEVGYESSTNRAKAIQLDLGELGDNDVFTEIKPRYTIIGNMIELRPTPLNNVADGLYMYYVEDPVAMADDDDTSGLPLEYDNLLPLYAAAKGSYTLGLHNEGNNFMAQFNLGLQEMENTIVERNIDTNGGIVVVDDYGGL